jgi:hypothetical protein
VQAGRPLHETAKPQKQAGGQQQASLLQLLLWLQCCSAL